MKAGFFGEMLSGERLYPSHPCSEANRAAHLERYVFAAARVEPGQQILDAGCGSGYGAEILARRGASVLGVELNDHALSYARRYHRHDRVEFRKGDLNQAIDLPDESIDWVVCLETLEHVRNQMLMLTEFRRLLRRGGHLILSTPDREVYTGKGHSRNPYHVAELSKNELLSLLRPYYEIYEVYGQGKYGTPLVNLARRLDVVKVRRVILRAARGSRRLGTTVLRSRLERMDPNEPNRHYSYLVIVAGRR